MNFIQAVNDLALAEAVLGQALGKLIECLKVKIEVLNLIVFDAYVRTLVFKVVVLNGTYIKGHTAYAVMTAVVLYGNIDFLTGCGVHLYHVAVVVAVTGVDYLGRKGARDLAVDPEHCFIAFHVGLDE